MKHDDAVYISQLRAQLEEYREDYKKQKGKADNRYKYMSMIAEKICSSEYGEKQLGGKNKILSLKDTELRDFIINDYNKQRGEYIQTIKQLQDAYLQQKEQATNLAKQILQLKDEKKKLEDTITLAKKAMKQKELVNPNTKIKKDGIKNDSLNEINEETPQFGEIEEETPQFGESENLQFEDIFKEAEKAAANENIFIFKNQPIDIKKTAETLNEIEKDILYAIGHEGLSETSLIKEWMEKEKNVNTSKTTKVLSNLNKEAEELDDPMPLLQKVKAGTPIVPNRYMYRLNSLGKMVYKHIYKKNAVKSEMELLTREHASLEHGMCIRDTANLLSNNSQFHDVKYFDKDNTFDVGGTERYIPDITAKNDKGEMSFWEVELAHHNDGQFFNKLEKAIKVTDILYIIAKDHSAQMKLKRQVNRFISKQISKKNPNELGANKRKTIYFYVFTMKELENKKIFQEDKDKSNNILKMK